MHRILVVEDNPANLELIREVLGSLKYEILEAADGQAALDLVKATELHLILLDIHLPIMDGYAVIREIRRDPRFRELKVAALTAYAMEGDRDKALRAGFDAYITKPINAASLRLQVHKLINK
jgi:CheY-like chemotaxis protein